MWGSTLIGDEYDAPLDELDDDTALIVKHLAQHPLFAKAGERVTPGAIGDGPSATSEGEGILAPKTNEGLANPEEEQKRRQKLMQTAGALGAQDGQMQLSFPDSGAGWFDTYFGKEAEKIVKDLRRARRVHKEFKTDIDDAIDAIRLMKRMEVEDTLKAIPWAEGHIGAIRDLGLSDRNLTALRKHAQGREVGLRRACLSWEKADEVIKRLSDHEGAWGETEQQEWVKATQLKKDAKKQWRNTLHQIDSLAKHEVMWLTDTANSLTDKGVLSTRSITENIVERGDNFGITTGKIGALLKTYGDEYGISKVTRNEWGVEDSKGVIIVKDVWAYAAGFLDADGYITITKRGEPRAGIIATGARGKTHCENLYKALGCGILQLDLKVHKNSRRSQHRLQFYSKDDLRKLLTGIRPHLKLKKRQADAVLELVELGKETIAKARKTELQRVVKWENWKDTKSEDLLAEWGVDVETVEKWSERDPELVILGAEAERLLGVIK